MTKKIVIKKKMSLDDLKALKELGIEIKRNYNLDESGTSGMGYVERRGLSINGIDYQVCFSSKGYGVITSDINELNGRWLDKYDVYASKVRKWWNEKMIPILEG